MITAKELRMTVSMYQVSVPLFVQGLTGLNGVLDKAVAHVEAKKLDPNALLQARLYPDMFPFTRQVQLASDFAKGPVGRLAGVELPVWEDTETTFQDLKGRIEKTIGYVKGFTAAQIDGSEDRDVTVVRRGESVTFKGQAYLLGQAVPNFYFHVTTAYAILRHNGVEVGKRDFLAMS
jgi:hypothetical protein